MSCLQKMSIRLIFISLLHLHILAHAQAINHDDLNRITQYHSNGNSHEFYYSKSGNITKKVLNRGASVTSKLPHSGVKSSQCVGGYGVELIECSSDPAITLSGAKKQDGMFADVNAMNYDSVGDFASTECVRDNITKLMWEGKAGDGGPRDGGRLYLIEGSGFPQSAIDYVLHVNSINLCGFSDWRIPSVDELHSIVDYGAYASGKAIDQSWFPNTNNRAYLTSVLWAGSYNLWFGVEFSTGEVLSDFRAADGYFFAIRLVRDGAR